MKQKTPEAQAAFDAAYQKAKVSDDELIRIYTIQNAYTIFGHLLGVRAGSINPKESKLTNVSVGNST